MSLWFHNAWFHVTRALQHGTQTLCHLGSVSLCHLGSTRLHITWQLHVTLCHWGSTIPGSVSPGLHVTMCHLPSPCPCVTQVPCHPDSVIVSPSSSVSLCHLGSTSPGLHDMGHRLCVTRAPRHPVSPGSSMSPCHCGSSMPGSMSPGLHVTLCHLPAPCPCVTQVPCYLDSTSPSHLGSAMPGSMSPGLHVTWTPCHRVTRQLHITVSLWFCNAWLHVTRAPCPCVTRVPCHWLSLCVTVVPQHLAPCHPAAPCHRVTLPPHHLASMSPCHLGSAMPGSMSPGLHDMGHRLCVTWQLHVTVSLCCLGSTSPGLHVTWTLHHRVTWQLCVPVSTRFHSAPCHPAAPCLCVTWAPHHPVSPGSSISPCHLGSTIPGSMSPGLHDMGHRLCVTRAL